jgi:hypothetical protein
MTGENIEILERVKPEEADSGPLTYTVDEAGDMADVCRATGYKLADDGTWPVVRMGRALRVLGRPFRRMLGVI